MTCAIVEEAPWQKLGLAFAAPGHGQMASRAMLPTPVVLEDRVRVLFASCDAELRGRIFFADFDRAPPFRPMGVSAGPILDLGAFDAFDADGVNPCHVVQRGDAWYLYYVGWRRISVLVPYTLLVGLAVSFDACRSFSRVRTTPILPPTPDERLFRTAPFVQSSDGGFEMFYIGGDRFFSGPSGKRLPIYALKHHWSPDGIVWTGQATTVMAPDANRGEIGFGRPYIWQSSWTGQSLMISVRTTSGYRLCQAGFSEGPIRSADLRPVLGEGPEAWDAEMTCFGAPCRLDDREVLFYCGNGMGQTGFGRAVRPVGPL